MPSPQAHDQKVMGMPKRRFFIVLGVVAFLILAIALGAGLGVGLNKKDSSEDGSCVDSHPNASIVANKTSNSSNSSNGESFQMDSFCAASPELCIGGSLNPEYLSTKGAFNGSGIALAGESWNEGQRRIFTVYYQHHTGDIRYMQYRQDQKWDGGNKAQTVASDAKNGTALSAVAYSINGTQYVSNAALTKRLRIKADCTM